MIHQKWEESQRWDVNYQSQTSYKGFRFNSLSNYVSVLKEGEREREREIEKKE